MIDMEFGGNWPSVSNEQLFDNNMILNIYTAKSYFPASA